MDENATTSNKPAMDDFGEVTNFDEETSKESRGKMSVDPYGIHLEVTESFGP